MPFIALPPCRLVDTRGDAPLTGGFLPSATVRSYTLTGVCNVPANAQAISLNATVVKPVGPGFLTLWQEGAAFPPVSTLNYLGNDVIANAAVVALSVSGGVSMALGGSGGDVVLDTNGYYAATPSVTSLNALTGDLTLAAGANVSITNTANTLTIAATGGGGGTPSGPAGGSLTATYPNPGIATGSVGAAQLANGTAVRSINGAAQDLVTIQGSGAVSVATTGSAITIGAPAGSMVLGAPNDTTLIGAGYTEIASTSIDYWTATATTGAPSGRVGGSAIWTGSRMIVWGGRAGGTNANAFLGDGGTYDPIANSWTATSATSAPSARDAHSAIWTGSRMIVWGGFGYGFPSGLADGGQYDPMADVWTPTVTAGAPSGRGDQSAVWTGTRMIVWGGWNGTLNLNDGGRYDPAGNAWTAMTTSGPPSVRSLHVAVWTGSLMVVWGGEGPGPSFLNDGGRYDPVGDVWIATTPTNAPSGRRGHTAVWTGSRMIVWGGLGAGFTCLGDGGQYDPGSDTWSATAIAGSPRGRGGHSAVWTGSAMVVWGGQGAGPVPLNDGGRYDPETNDWTATTKGSAPSARSGHSAVWTGLRMIVWSGQSDLFNPAFPNDGGLWGTVSLYRKN